MKKSLWLCALLIAPSVHAWNCKYEQKLDQVLDLSGSNVLTVNAAAGDLQIRGASGSDQAVIRGKICASDEKLLSQARVLTEGGMNAEITVDLPKLEGGWSIMGDDYSYIDLELEVPDSIALEVNDSSGDMEIEGVGPLVVKDSSGDVEITDIQGTVSVTDSSGDVEIEDVRGDVIVESDSSGDLEGDHITGNVLVQKDSSGDIHFSDVDQNFTVERDSSGDITGRNIGGNFTVEKDGSGGIRSDNVAGEVNIPEKS